jgi:hypothetical protein
MTVIQRRRHGPIFPFERLHAPHANTHSLICDSPGANLIARPIGTMPERTFEEQLSIPRENIVQSLDNYFDSKENNISISADFEKYKIVNCK